MLQQWSKLEIKDDSGFGRGYCIQKSFGKGKIGWGNRIVTKSKKDKKTSIKMVLLIQTKEKVLRFDGSSVNFVGNKGIIIKKGLKGWTVGCKRIKSKIGWEVLDKTTTNQLKNCHQIAGISRGGI